MSALKPVLLIVGWTLLIFVVLAGLGVCIDAAVQIFQAVRK